MKRTGMILAVLLFGFGLFALPARAAIGLEAIEARVGFADLEEEAGSTFILSAAADMGQLTEDIGFELNVDFWTKGWDVGFFDWSATNFGFMANGNYAFPMEGSFHPFVFAGVGLLYQTYSADCDGCIFDFDDADESEIEFGVDLGVGAYFGSGEGMTPTVRAGYNTNGGFDYLFIQAGLRFPMGQ